MPTHHLDANGEAQRVALISCAALCRHVPIYVPSTGRAIRGRMTATPLKTLRTVRQTFLLD